MSGRSQPGTLWCEMKQVVATEREREREAMVWRVVYIVVR